MAGGDLLASGRQIERFLHGAALGHDFVLQQRDGINQLLGAWRTSGDVDINGDNLIDALHQRVIIENAAGGGASSHGDDPLRFRHLLPELANYWGHFVRNAASNDHQVGLARGWAEDLGSEARDIETRRAHRHHFDGAAGEAERHRPDGIFAHPVDGRVERRHDDAFGDAVSIDKFFDYFLAVFDVDVGAETEFWGHGYILTADDAEREPATDITAPQGVRLWRAEACLTFP
jgi:hypothetical protein